MGHQWPETISAAAKNPRTNLNRPMPARSNYMSTISIFVSYSHEDTLWMEPGDLGLIPWLARALEEDEVEFWFDHELKREPGKKFREKIETEIDRAHFALLLISQDFVSSKFIREVELKRIRERVERNELSIIPILVGPTSWRGKDDLRWLVELQIIPGKPTPLIDYTTDIAKWKHVRVEILEAIQNRIDEKHKAIPVSPVTPRESVAPGMREEQVISPESVTVTVPISPDISRQIETGSGNTDEVVSDSIADVETIGSEWSQKVEGEDARLTTDIPSEAGSQQADSSEPGEAAKTTTSVITRRSYVAVLNNLKSLSNNLVGGASKSRVLAALAVSSVLVLSLFLVLKHYRSLRESHKSVVALDYTKIALLRTLESNEPGLRSVALSPDGKTLACGCGLRVILFNTATGELIRTLTGHGRIIPSVAFSPDGNMLATAGENDETARLWDVQTGESKLVLKWGLGKVFAVAFSPDGKILASGGPWGFALWNAQTGESKLQKTDTSFPSSSSSSEAVQSLAFSPDGKLIATGMGRTVRLLDAETGARRQTLESKEGNVSSVAFSPDGNTLASAKIGYLELNGNKRIGNEIDLWNVRTGDLEKSLTVPDEQILSLVFLPDGKTLFSGSHSGTIRASGVGTSRLWDAEAGKLLRTLVNNIPEVSSVSVSSNGRVLVGGSFDGTIRVWGINEPTERPTVGGTSAPMRAEGTPTVTPVATPAQGPTTSMASNTTTPAPTPTRRKPEPTISASTYTHRAQALYGQRKYREALNACNQALKIDPKNQQAIKLKEQINKTCEILGCNQ